MASQRPPESPTPLPSHTTLVGAWSLSRAAVLVHGLGMVVSCAVLSPTPITVRTSRRPLPHLRPRFGVWFCGPPSFLPVSPPLTLRSSLSSLSLVPSPFLAHPLTHTSTHSLIHSHSHTHTPHSHTAHRLTENEVNDDQQSSAGDVRLFPTHTYTHTNIQPLCMHPLTFPITLCLVPTAANVFWSHHSVVYYQPYTHPSPPTAPRVGGYPSSPR